MTAVDTTEPPRLPVRDRTAAAERAWGGVSPMLTRLAAERATGVLVRECGTLHLDEGRVVHAESPLAPGLEVLLTAHGTLRAEVWQDAVSRAGDHQGAARLLLADGHLAEGALQLCHLGALHDAAYFALAPSSTPGRFRYGAARRPDPLPPVPVAALEREALRRRELLHRIWPDPRPDGTALVRTHTTGAPGLTARQQTLLDRVDGTRTATDLARELGRQAFHTLVDVRRLASAGLVAPRQPAEGAEACGAEAYGAEAYGADAYSTAAHSTAVHSTAAYGGPPVDSVPGLTELPAQYAADPHITLLKRLRDALEAL
ncbi:hypothetical protein ABZ858_03570 [Streptomyces sp. NPDC047017]|uniref:hypothetical protein n=1 Tax=Streptomyces sp. NPDC047017 TaxID=3155024 RepID=UPI0033D04EDA